MYSNRLPIAIGLIVAVACAGRHKGVGMPADKTAQNPTDSPASAVVQYVKVEGQRCLYPKVVAGVPEDIDFVQAQYRWLRETYPGYRLVQQSHVLALAPEFRPENQKSDDEPADWDSLELTLANGETVSVCFALTTLAARSNDK